MTLKVLARLTNKRIRVIVGMGLLALVCIQCTRPIDADFKASELVSSIDGQVVGTTSDDMARRIDTLAKTDPIALLKLCIANYDAKVQDYRCRFTRQERINGAVTSEQEVLVKFRQDPFSVAMGWVRGKPRGDRALFIEGRNDGNMLIRPTGAFARLAVGKRLSRKPDSKEVMANTLRPITQFGFRRSLVSLRKVYEIAAERGDLQTRFVRYADVGGRPAIVIERILPARDDYPAKKTLIYIDTELLIPTGIEAWDWNDELESRYMFTEIKMNVGLTDEDFTPEANGM